MRNTRLIAILVGLAAIAIVAADAQAIYHPGMGCFLQRDPGAGAARAGAGGPAAGGGFAQRDPTGQYADGMNLYQYTQSDPVRKLDPYGLDSIFVYDRRPGQQTANDGRHWSFEWAEGCGTCTNAQKAIVKDAMWHAIHRIVYARMDVKAIVRKHPIRDMWGGEIDANWSVDLSSGAYKRLLTYGLLINGGSSVPIGDQVAAFADKLTSFTDNMFHNDGISIACDTSPPSFIGESGGKPCAKSATIAWTYGGDGSRAYTKGGRYRRKLFICPAFFTTQAWDEKIQTIIHELSHQYINTEDDLGGISGVYHDGTNYWSNSGHIIGGAVPGAGFAQYQSHADTMAWTLSQWGS